MRDIEREIEQNREAKFYCFGKAPKTIKAVKEFLQAWVERPGFVTIGSVSEKYGVSPTTISRHAHALSDILGIARTPMPHLGKLTFYHYESYRHKTRVLLVQCPKCKHEFGVTFGGRILTDKNLEEYAKRRAKLKRVALKTIKQLNYR